MDKNIIWSNTYDAIEELEKDIRENPGMYNLAANATDEDILNLVNEYIRISYNDEKKNLDRDLGKDIVVICTSESWNGSCHNIARIGRNLNKIITSPYNHMDFCEVYADRHNILWNGYHHDGCNHALFRKMKNDAQYLSFCNALAQAKDEYVWKRVITYYTTSLRPIVANIYGWK